MRGLRRGRAAGGGGHGQARGSREGDRLRRALRGLRVRGARCLWITAVVVSLEVGLIWALSEPGEGSRGVGEVSAQVYPVETPTQTATASPSLTPTAAS